MIFSMEVAPRIFASLRGERTEFNQTLPRVRTWVRFENGRHKFRGYPSFTLDPLKCGQKHRLFSTSARV